MDINKELQAMTAVSDALGNLDDDEARSRVIRWAAEAFGTQLNSTVVRPGRQRGEVPPTNSDEFESIGRLFEVASPGSNPERVLVAAYWHQVTEGEEELSGQTINNDLKHMGYPVPNITATMTSLMDRKPALMRQVRKSGKTKQARKQYAITEAGKAYVRGLQSGPRGDDIGDDQ